ncbi:hypothetical protein Tco_0562453 [Tanacetum coccineum]
MTKINDVEANLEQFKSETLARQKETSNRFDRMQATIEKNKVESDQQFAEIMRMLKTLQPATTVEGKRKGVFVNSFEVGTDEENNNSDIVLNGNDTWADAGLNHGSYLLLNRIVEDGWYFLDESGLSKEPLCRSNLEVHLQFHVDRLETGSQVKTWDPGITGGGMWNQHLEDKVFLGAGVLIRTYLIVSY